jgi:hypothetical protein
MKYTSSIFLLLITNILLAQPNFDWATSNGGNGDEDANDITVDNQGNVISTGFFSATVDFDPGPGTHNLSEPLLNSSGVFIQKLDRFGNFIWAKSLGGAGTDIGWSITHDNQGNIYISGEFQETVDFDPGSGIFNLTTTHNSAGYFESFILKLDANGNFIWAKRLSSFNTSLSSSRATNIEIDILGNILISGTYGGSLDLDPSGNVYSTISKGDSDIYLVKLDANGNFIWGNSYGGIERDEDASLKIDNQNNIYLSGVFRDTVDFDPGIGVYNLITDEFYWDIFIQKLNPNGNLIWAGNIGQPSIDENIYDMDIDNNNMIYFTGSYSGTVDFDFGAGVYNLTGTSFFVCKYDSSGSIVWAIGESNGYAGGWKMAVDGDGNIYSAGRYSSNPQDIDPGIGTFTVNPVGGLDSYIQKLDSSGNFIWGYALAGSGGDWVRSVHIDTNNNIYYCGKFENTLDFDPSSSTFNLTSNAQYDLFVSKLNPSTVGLPKHYKDNRLLTVYPNPTKGNITVTRGNNTPAIIELIDFTGKVLYKSTINSYSYECNLSNLSKGVYLFKITDNTSHQFTHKIVKN